MSPLRVAVVATALATIAAGVPALLSTGASAAPTGDIQLAGPTHGAAGACLTYTVTPTDAFGRVASDTGTIVVRLTENPNNSTQDVDFCTVAGSTTPSAAPHYTDANATLRTYTAGPTITSASPADVASMTTPAAQANPLGRDTARFVYSGGSTVTFGVV